MIIEALKSLLIGIVEGVTEWLPISSTGHMILVDDFVQLQVSPEFLALFLVVIQIGAILAVLTLYFHKLNPLSQRKAPMRSARPGVCGGWWPSDASLPPSWASCSTIG